MGLVMNDLGHSTCLVEMLTCMMALEPDPMSPTCGPMGWMGPLPVFGSTAATTWGCGGTDGTVIGATGATGPWAKAFGSLTGVVGTEGVGRIFADWKSAWGLRGPADPAGPDGATGTGLRQYKGRRSNA